jgi:hypothetical protein
MRSGDRVATATKEKETIATKETVAPSTVTPFTPEARIARVTPEGKIAAEFMKQWMFGPADPPTSLSSKPSFDNTPTHLHNLYNSRERLFLQHEEQTFGITWGGRMTPRHLPPRRSAVGS